MIRTSDPARPFASRSGNPQPRGQGRARRLLLVLLLVTSACAAGPSGPGADLTGDAPPLAIVGATVLPMTDDAVLVDHTVVVEDGRITALGPTARTPVPPGAVTVDGRGRWLLPGLVDMHVHLNAEGEGLLYVAHGVTTVRNMWGGPRQLGWRQDYESGESLGPRMITTGPIMDGDPPFWPGSMALTDPEEARASVAEQAAAGYDALKVYATLPADVYAAVVEAGAEHGLPVVGHVPHPVGLTACLAAGQHTIEHLDGTDRALLAARGDSATAGAFLIERHRALAGTPPRTAELEALAATLAAHPDTWQVPTLVTLRHFVPPHEAARQLQRPEMRFVSPMTRRFWNPTDDRRTRTYSDEDWQSLRAGDQRRLDLVAALHRAGVPLLVGTDAPNPFIVPGFALREELELFVAAGLTPYQALAAATREPARALGHAGEFGTLVPGAAADLLLLEADPLEDVGHVHRRAGVVLRGRWHPEDELQQLLEERARRFDGIDG